MVHGRSDFVVHTLVWNGSEWECVCGFSSREDGDARSHYNQVGREFELDMHLLNQQSHVA